MNPPSALHGAMSRDRKPFTYTPGGLDLSEIKSERMAKRLMRNAMNQGVPETPAHSVHSQSNISTPVALPNYNCLPVQVFPTFNLPANPKSLLRTRSDPRETPIQRIVPSTVNSTRFDNNDTFNNNNKYTPTYSQANNNRPVSMFEYNPPPVPAPVNTYSLPRVNYGSDGYTAPVLPEISYEAEYFRAPPKVYSATEQLPKLEISEDRDKLPVNESVETSLDLTIKPLAEVTIPTFVPTPVVTNDVVIPTIAATAVVPNDVVIPTMVPTPVVPNDVVIPTIAATAVVTNDVVIPTIVATPVATNDGVIPTVVPTPVVPNDVVIPTIVATPVATNDGVIPTVVPTPVVPNDVVIPTIVATPVATNDVVIPIIVPTPVVTKEVTIQTISSPQVLTEEVTIPTEYPTPVLTKPVEENAGAENEQKEVKVVKKQVKKENKVEEQNGNQNGDANVESDLTAKLPTKKSAAKTETKVEVVKKVLPDGSVEEVKTTTTKTTIDGRTEIKTKTETTIIPKEEESEEEVVEEEEEEGEVEEVKDEEPETTTVTTTVAAPKENGRESKVVKTEERSESTTTTTKKVVIVQDSPKEKQSVEVEEQQEQEEEEVEEEVVEEAKPVTVVLKKQATPEPPVVESKPVEEEEEEDEEEEVEEEPEEEEKPAPKEVKKEVEPEEEEDEEEEVVEVKKQEVKAPPPKDEEEEEEEEEEYEEVEEKEETKVEVKKETEGKETKEEEEEEEVESVEEEKQAISEKPVEEVKKQEEKVTKVEVVPPEEPKEEKLEPTPQAQYNIPIREPSIPLDKVEDVEIKPIGSSPIISKTHTENTEIITSTIDPSSGLSRQTEYNKIENIVTVNRTTKILDHNYENLTQQGIPTVRTYFPPPTIDKISTSPLPSRPYQPAYPPEPTTERRHSLLLERLSMERQMPSDIYQYGNQNNQSHDQNQYQNEPRAEVLTVSNVKPSSITSDQQWYQKTSQNLIYNNVSSTPTPTGQPWAQPKSQPQPHLQYQPQPHYQAQHQPQQQYQPPTQQYQPSPTPQPQYQPSPTPQPQYQPSSAPQYQQSYSEPAAERAPSSYSTYTPTPTWATNTDSQQNTTQSNQYSYKDTSDSYLKSTQQYSSSYVPPPWEQDTSYTSVNNTSQVYYAPAPLPETQSFNPAPASGWKPPPAKFTKTTPIAYIPPAPNQSFVRSASVSEPSRTPGRKTYYSEYERRYITVPESTYIPSETKYQPQPDPSPQYYYDNNEPSEEVEPQWRRELREFTEKTSQTTTTTTEQTNVQPPWQAEANYPKNQSVAYTPTPTWSQTLRPRSFRERSFESEYVSQEWPKTNTLGRGRPLSTIAKSVDAPIPERTRGVSVDRYNPVSYHSPSEHPPVQAHTLTTPVPHSGYHNPNVPAYHTRASAEPREQPTSYQPRVYRESRASPLQSRSFKYLQWITGTEN